MHNHKIFINIKKCAFFYVLTFFFTFIQFNFKISICTCRFFLLILHVLIHIKKHYYQTYVSKLPYIALHESVSLIGDAADARIGFAYDRADYSDYLYIHKVKGQVLTRFANELPLQLSKAGSTRRQSGYLSTALLYFFHAMAQCRGILFVCPLV